MFRHLKAFRESQGIKELGEDDYLGNIWGWKVSFFGLALLGFLIALYFYRVTYYPQDINVSSKEKVEQLIQD